MGVIRSQFGIPLGGPNPPQLVALSDQEPVDSGGSWFRARNEWRVVFSRSRCPAGSLWAQKGGPVGGGSGGGRGSGGGPARPGRLEWRRLERHVWWALCLPGTTDGAAGNPANPGSCLITGAPSQAIDC